MWRDIPITLETLKIEKNAENVLRSFHGRMHKRDYNGVLACLYGLEGTFNRSASEFSSKWTYFEQKQPRNDPRRVT